MVHGGNFNLFFEAKLETQGRKTVLKNKSLGKKIQINKGLD